MTQAMQRHDFEGRVFGPIQWRRETEMITIHKIDDEGGLAVCIDGDSNRRVDVYPAIPARAPEMQEPSVRLFSSPALTATQAREYAVLLEEAADHADQLATNSKAQAAPAGR